MEVLKSHSNRGHSRVANALKGSIFSPLLLLAMLAPPLSFPLLASAQESVIWSFAGGTAGATPLAGLTPDTAGNLYGTTSSGGTHGYGTVFELSPGTGSAWTEKTLYSFGATGADATNPGAGLTIDSSGNLYGTTAGGGIYDYGTVFELSKGTGGTWTEKVLSNFGNYYGAGTQPEAGLIIDGKGNLYGTTGGGGANQMGTVFELSPATGGTWTLNYIWNFGTGALYEDSPFGSLVVDADGNLYGTTADGGDGAYFSGSGTAFELSPGTGGVWTEKILYSFGATSTDARTPSANMVFDTHGNLYGTSIHGGAQDNTNGGTVFELSPSTGGVWTEQVLWSFGGGSDGLNPGGNLIIDAQGNLYGVTTTGGLNSNDGIAFELSPAGGGVWSEKILHNFGATSSDGQSPYGSLLADTAGNLYGVTGSGGIDSSGTAFKIAGVIQSAAATPTFSPAPGTYSEAQTVEISDTTTGATIYYTTNGSTPTTSSTKYSQAIDVSATETIKAIAVATGLPNSPVASATYTIASPAATLSATSLSFPSTAVGSTSTLSFTITNSGGGDLSVTGISNTGTNPSDFSHTSNCGGNPLAAGSACTVAVTFTPAAAGTFSATLNIADNATGSPQTVTMTGTGTASGPMAKLSTTSLSFPATAVGSTSTLPLTITNSGSGSLSVSAIGNTGTNPSDFSHTSNCGGNPLATGKSCTVEVTFTPAAAGTFTATLNITDNATGSPQTVTMTGTGTASGPIAKLSATSLSFPATAVGSTSTLALTITNSGTGSLSVSAIGNTGTNPSDFSHTSNCGGNPLAAGKSCTVEVTFTPAAAATFTATLNITDNATGSPQAVTMTGTGTASGQ
jgi:uncharacterized repeat protein (TIGR03803 family)